MWSRTWRAWSRRRASRSASAPVERVEVGRERCLGVDDDGLPARQAHDQVGAELAVRRGDGGLLLEVAVLDHPRHLDHPPELHLAPAPAHAGRPQGLHQVAGLGVQPMLRLGHRLDLLEQRRVGAGPRELDLVQRAVHPGQRVAERAAPGRPRPAAAPPGRRPRRGGALPAWSRPAAGSSRCSAGAPRRSARRTRRARGPARRCAARMASQVTAAPTTAPSRTGRAASSGRPVTGPALHP